MCKPSYAGKPAAKLIRTWEVNQTSSKGNKVSLKWPAPKLWPVKVWPLQPNSILLLTCFLPFYLNQFYTTWYNSIAIFYFLTNIEPIRRFLIVQGIGVCSGWYAAMAHDFIHYGRFGHTLYMNMPPSVRSFMVDESGEVFYTYKSLFFMAGSHASDTFCHPGIAYIMYLLHRRAGGTLDEIFSWKILVAAFVLARFWSLVHNLNHNGKVGFWYVGHDVYHILDLECFKAAYGAEGVAFAFMIGHNIFHRIYTKLQKMKE